LWKAAQKRIKAVKETYVRNGDRTLPRGLRDYLNTWATYGLMLSDISLFDDKMPERRLDQYPVVRRFPAGAAARYEARRDALRATDVCSL
jgi:hypothetical protein